MALDFGLLGNEFFSNVILPFVLIFTIVYAILEKTELVTKKRDINAIIALIIGLISIGVPAAIGTLQRFIPIISVILIILFAFMLILGFANTRLEVEWSGGLRKFFLAFLGIVLLATAAYAIGETTGIFSSMNVNQALSSQVIQTILFVGAIVAVVAVVVASEEPHKTEKGKT